MKRQDYINWDEYFMGIAMLAARRSKDPNTQVGACIVSARRTCDKCRRTRQSIITTFNL